MGGSARWSAAPIVADAVPSAMLRASNDKTCIVLLGLFPDNVRRAHRQLIRAASRGKLLAQTPESEAGRMPSAISFTVNGKQTTVETDPQRTLLEVLREDLQLTGTKYGCGEGACGACGVLIDGRRIFSCSTTAQEVAGKSITTIEGIAMGDQLHPVQQAFLEEKSFQCGYCTAGMIINCVALLKRNSNPTEEEICSAMNGNICRCCTYPRIVDAVKRASAIAKEVSHAQ